MPKRVITPVDIAARLGSYIVGKVKPDGETRARCPFCDPDRLHGDSLSFSVKGWICYRCGAKGSLVQLAERLGIATSESQPVATLEQAARALRNRLGPKAAEIAQAFKIQSVAAAKAWKFPVGDNAKWKPWTKGVGRQGWVRANGEKCPWLYGLDHFASPEVATEVAYLVEGEPDVWAMTAAGLPAFTFTRGATSLPPKDVVTQIRSYRIEKIVVIYDADRAGIVGSLGVAALLRDAGMRVELRRWPAGYPKGFDVSDLWRQSGYDPMTFRAALAKLQVVDIPPTPPKGFWIPEVPHGTFEPPSGYVLSEDGTYKVEAVGNGGARLISIARQPIWLEAHHVGLDENECAIAVATLHHGRVRRETVSRAVVRDHNRLVGLARAGFPVDTLNSKQLVSYLVAAEEANVNTLPKRETVSRNGWHGNDEFIIGRVVLTRSGGCRPVEPSATAGIDDSWFDCYRSEGSEETWAQILPILVERPMAFVGVAAAVASPLLLPLGAPGYNVEWFGTSSGGKTTTIRCAMSVYGPCGLEDIPSWDHTRVAIETHAAVRGNLPLFLDEIKQFQGRSEDLARIAYLLTSGKGRGRSNKELGIREIKSWRLVALWTGEQSVRDMTKDSGIHPRVLAFQGVPFGGPDEASRAAVEAVERIISEHYGHAGPRFIRHLLQLDEAGWRALRQEYRDSISHLRAIAPARVPANFLDRWAKAFATMMVSARILADLYPAKLNREAARGCLESAWRILCEQSVEEVDYAGRALYDVLDWVASQTSDFTEWVRRGEPLKRKHLGRRVDEGLAIIGRELATFLEEQGYSPKVVREQWAARGWIITDEGKPYFKNVKFGRYQARCIVITHAALALHAGEQPADGLPARHTDVRDGAYRGCAAA